jgi:release factor glutamine methyltransferase
VAANPPYVTDAELGGLAPEVRDHEPRVALAAGPDGLAALGRLVAEAPRVLAPGGWLVVEVGAGQATAVRGLARFARVEVVRDHAGIERVLAMRLGGGGWTRS